LFYVHAVEDIADKTSAYYDESRKSLSVWRVLPI